MASQMSNKSLLAFALGLGIVIAIILMAMSAPIQVTADDEDEVLIHLQYAYDDSGVTERNALEAYQRSLEVYYNAALTSCENWKALAYYKKANNYEMTNEISLEEIDAVKCEAMGF